MAVIIICGEVVVDLIPVSAPMDGAAPQYTAFPNLAGFEAARTTGPR
jgi:hypothetical protein